MSSWPAWVRRRRRQQRRVGWGRLFFTLRWGIRKAWRGPHPQVAAASVSGAGIGGGFAGVADIGSLVVASEIIAADLGAETPDGFTGVDELGFGSPRIAVADELSSRWAASLREAGLPVHHGPILTLSTVTGTAETARVLAERYPGAGAEAMEGFGVAEAARQFGVPVLELRAISNAVGPRQRELWKIGDALQALEQACAKLPEVLQS